MSKSGRTRSERSTAKVANIAQEVAPLATEKGRFSPVKPCLDHIGSQLAALKKDGRAYICSRGKECTYQHISVSGKSHQKLKDIISTMPNSVRADLTKALEERK